MPYLDYDLAGTGPPLLLLHGFPLNRSLWRHQVENLRGVRRIAPDLRGMGGSPVPAAGYSMEAYAQDLVSLLDSLQLETAVVCGLSMGGYIAFELWRQARERISGLILMDTTAAPDTEEGRRNRDRLAARAGETGPEGLAREMAPRLLAPASLERGQAAARLETMIAATPLAGFVGALAAMRDRPDSRRLLEELGQVPTLVVVGSEDEVTPVETATSMADAIPGARLQIIPGAGHLPPLELPEATTSVMARFLAEAL